MSQKINHMAAAAAVLKDAVLVDVSFENVKWSEDDVKNYTYLALKKDGYEKGDIVIVPVRTCNLPDMVDEPASHIKAATVTRVKDTSELDIYGDFSVRFVIDKIDLDEFDRRTKGVIDISKKIRNVDRGNQQKQILMALGLDKPMSLPQLEHTSDEELDDEPF